MVVVRPESRFTLVFVSNKALFFPLLRVVFPRMIMIGLTFAQPFLITRVLDLLQEPSSSLTENQSYGLIGATAIIYLGIAVSHNLAY
jgi:ATP-binding cassette subfamily C (CFTR/MRP) protein 1